MSINTRTQIGRAARYLKTVFDNIGLIISATAFVLVAFVLVVVLTPVCGCIEFGQNLLATAHKAQAAKNVRPTGKPLNGGWTAKPIGV